jgi:hypothetical protein
MKRERDARRTSEGGRREAALKTWKRSSHALSSCRFARAGRPRDQHVRTLLAMGTRGGQANMHVHRADASSHTSCAAV